MQMVADMRGVGVKYGGNYADVLYGRPLTTYIQGLLVILVYRTRAIISRGLYVFYPISKDHFFVFKEVFSENFVLMYGLYSRAASNQERLMMARLR